VLRSEVAEQVIGDIATKFDLHQSLASGNDRNGNDPPE
jgi:hypothetical protein